MLLHDDPRGGLTIHFGHHQVHEDQIGEILARLLDGFPSVHRGPRQFEAVLHLDDPTQCLGRHPEIVDDRDSHASIPRRSRTVSTNDPSRKLPLVR